MKITFRTVFTVLLFCIMAYTSSAQSEPLDEQVVYKGQSLKMSQLVEQRVLDTPLYCGYLLTAEIIKRGYFDARIDSKICFDTEKALQENSENNNRLIELYAGDSHTSRLDGDVTLRGASCDELNRGTGFPNSLYQGTPYDDVCSEDLQTDINTNGDIRSVWLVGGSCAAITITSNEYPWPQVSYVDYSTAFDSFLYVINYKWTPPSC